MRHSHGSQAAAQLVHRFDTFPSGGSQSHRPLAAEVSELWGGIAKAPEKAPARPSVAQVAKKRGAVKAMAAMFEGEESKQLLPSRPEPQSRTQSLISHYSQASPEKSIRSSRSGSVWTQQSVRMPSLSDQNQRHSRNLSGNIIQQANTILDQKARNSMNENLALRQESTLDVGKPDQGFLPDKPQIMLFRKPIPIRKPNLESNGASLQSPPSLGTMIPHPEHPPIAQHLNLLRPSSSTSNIQQDSEFLSLPQSTSTPTPRPGSTTMLHTQIRILQRQLEAKTEEAAQLRRQLEVQENADVGTMSQQLRQAMIEAQTWKERAEAAERRVKVFERFTARLRGMREVAATANRQSNGSSSASNSTVHDGGGKEDGQSVYQRQHSSGENQRTGRQVSDAHESDTSRRTEDVGVITARIRKCLHGGPGRTDGPIDSPPPCLQDLVEGVKGVGCEDRMRELSLSTVEVWMAAQELFDLEESR